MFASLNRIALIAAFFFVNSLGDVGAPAASVSPPKPWVTHLLIAYAWPSGYSEVWVIDSGAGGHIVSNIDFQIFGPTFAVETADAVHDFVVLGTTLTAGDVLAEQQSGYLDAHGAPKNWPVPLPPPTRSGQYVAFVAPPVSRADLQIFDAIHRFYQANRAAIEAAAGQRELEEQRLAAAEAKRKAVTVPASTDSPVSFKRIEYRVAAPASRR